MGRMGIARRGWNRRGLFPSRYGHLRGHNAIDRIGFRMGLSVSVVPLANNDFLTRPLSRTGFVLPLHRHFGPPEGSLTLSPGCQEFVAMCFILIACNAIDQDATQSFVSNRLRCKARAYTRTHSCRGE